jgi:hypothetical protein
MKRHLPFARRQLILFGILFAMIVFHVASLCVDIRYYGSSLSFKFGDGFFTLFWGGDAKERNFCVCNAGEWPLRPETHFAGEEVPGNGHKWETCIQSLDFDRYWFPESIQHNGFFRTFGYSSPQIRRGDETASFLIPLGSVTLIVEVCTLLFIITGWRPNKSPEPTPTAP